MKLKLKLKILIKNFETINDDIEKNLTRDYLKLKKKNKI